MTLRFPSWSHLPAPPADYDYRGRTQCAQCRRIVLSSEVFTAVEHLGRSTVQRQFCGQACADEYHLEKLRRAGL